jgi:phage baseplate assembly protein gpV
VDIVDHIVGLYIRLQRLEGRAASGARHGTVAEVDTATQKVRVRIGGTDEEPFLSGWVPYSQVAGPGTGLKVHAPPTVGQNMTLVSPTGDLRQTVAVPFTWSDQAASPGTTADPAITYGDVRIDLATTSAKVTIGGTILEVAADKIEATIGGAKLTLNATDFLAVFDKAKFEGSSLKHNIKSVGDTHKHLDVMPGPDKTGVPE